MMKKLMSLLDSVVVKHKEFKPSFHRVSNIKKVENHLNPRQIILLLLLKNLLLKNKERKILKRLKCITGQKWIRVIQMKCSKFLAMQKCNLIKRMSYLKLLIAQTLMGLHLFIWQQVRVTPH